MQFPFTGGARAALRARRRGKSLSRFSFSALAAVFLLLSTSFAAGIAHQLHQLSPAISALSQKPKYLVLIVLDGAQPRMLHLGTLPHLDALRNQGTEYDRAWAGILESETPSGHAAIATGSTPARDGLLGFNWIRSNTDAVRLFDPSVVRQGGIERVMQAAGAPTIASLFKARFPKAKVLAVSGHKYYAADPLGGPAADYILYYAPDGQNHYVPMAIPGHVPPASVMVGPGLTTPTTVLQPGQEDTLAVKLALHSFRLVHQQITLINLPEFDYPLGHVYGAEAARARVLMQDFDRDLGRIEDEYSKAGVLDQTLFVVTADHGMAPLSALIPDAILDNAVLKAGTTAPETTYSTAGYIWLQDHSRAQQVAANIVAAKDPHIQSIYYKVIGAKGDSYIRSGGLPITPAVDAANQYLLTSFLGGNAPDVVAFCTEDTAFISKGAESWKGNHGGGAWQSQHIPLVISGAGALPGTVSHAPARLEDIAPTVLAMMGVPSSAMQGTILADATQTPAATEVQRQQALTHSLSPLVDALAAQSRQEVAAQ